MLFIILNLVYLLMTLPLIHSSLQVQHRDPLDYMVCPEPHNLPPGCGCRLIPSSSRDPVIDMIDLACGGSTVTNNSLPSLITAVLEANDLHWTSRLVLHSLRLEDTTLTFLDLTPLLTTDVRGRFLLSHNPYLTQISGTLPPSASAGSSKHDWKIKINGIYIEDSPLSTESIESMLKFVHPSTLTTLHVIHCKIQNVASQDGSIIPGLFSFNLLENLNLDSNELSSIDGGGFKKLTSLRTLSLADNLIRNLEENCFKFDMWAERVKGKELLINLTSNLLTDDGINPNTGLGERLKRPLKLFMGDNEFQTLSESTWKGIVGNDNEKVEIDFEGNRFHCDQFYRWIQRDRQVYQNRFKSITCFNDPDRKSLYQVNLDLLIKCAGEESNSSCWKSSMAGPVSDVNGSGNNTIDKIVLNLLVPIWFLLVSYMC